MGIGQVGMGSMLPFRSGWKVKGSGNQGNRCPEPCGGAVEALSSATICLSFPPGFGAPLLSSCQTSFPQETFYNGKVFKNPTAVGWAEPAGLGFGTGAAGGCGGSLKPGG